MRPVIVVLLFAIQAAFAAEKSVEVCVEEAAGVERPSWPVTFGVPFAPGQLKDVGALRLSNGKALPLQASASAKWRDGSVKWALVDSQVDLPASGAVKLKLAWDGQGASPAPASKLSVQTNADGVSVDTGTISFRLTSSGGGVPEDVRLKGTLVSKRGLHDLSYVTAGPELNSAEMRGNWKRPVPTENKIEDLSATGAKAEVIIEQRNDLRATVLVRGWYQKGDVKACRFDVRVTAFAGKPYLRIQHTLTYTEDPAKFFVCGLRMRFGMDGIQEAAFGGEGASLHKVRNPQGAHLLLPGPEINHNGITLDAAAQKIATYDVFDGAGKKIPGATGKEPSGVLSANNAACGITLGVRDFRHLHPKELAADSQGIEVGLWPRDSGLLIDCRNSLFGQTIRGETTLKGVACGWAKSHELWVSYHTADAAGGKSALSVARAASEPAYVTVAPKHVCDSGAFGIIAPVCREIYPGLEMQHDTLWAWVDKNRDVFRWDGFFNFGGILIEFDNHGQRYSNGPRGTWCWRDYAGWILNDGQLGHQLFRAYARSGDRHYLKTAEEVARNIGDESTVHHFNASVPGAHPVGAAHRHDMLPWGAGVCTYGMDVLGNCDLWYLTGDLRARDVLRDYADNLSKGGPGLIEQHGVGSLLCRLGEALEKPELIETGKTKLIGDIAEAANPGFRSWTDDYMPMILAYDICGDESLKKALFTGADAACSSGECYGTEITAWAYLQSGDSKYLEGLKTCLAKNPNVSKAAAHAGNPWKEDWNALRARMNEMPAWYVKTYINVLQVGRYPAAIRALEKAGITEKALKWN